ncbi:MAG: protein kinase [Oscillospiraceae bacterium]
MNLCEKYPLALQTGSVLAGQYIIETVLGQGGFGITYKARDYQTGQFVAIKEFFPDSFANRKGTTVIPYSEERAENFEYGKESFLSEAKTLARFIGNEHIVRIYSYFEENGTAYFVMDFIEGKSFDVYLKEKGGKVSFEEAETILIPVMDALSAVHAAGIIHRDVTPDNIYITKDGTVKLIDFGAARYSLGDKSKSLDVILKHGFAPKEQYTRHGKQGAYTDVYSLGATFYFALTGRRPPDSIDRMEEDDIIPPSNLGVKITEQQEDAILKALNVHHRDRFQSMGEFKAVLLGMSIPTQQPVSVMPIPQPVPVAPTPQSEPFASIPQSVPVASAPQPEPFELVSEKAPAPLPDKVKGFAGTMDSGTKKKVGIGAAILAFIVVVIAIPKQPKVQPPTPTEPTSYVAEVVNETENPEPVRNSPPIVQQAIQETQPPETEPPETEPPVTEPPETAPPETEPIVVKALDFDNSATEGLAASNVYQGGLACNRDNDMFYYVQHTGKAGNQILKTSDDSLTLSAHLYENLFYFEGTVYYLYGGIAYFVRDGEGYKIPELSSVEHIEEFYIAGDYYYYVVRSDDNIYRTNRNSGATESLPCDGIDDGFIICGGYLYYLIDYSDVTTKNMVRVSLDSFTVDKEIFMQEEKLLSDFAIDGNYIYVSYYPYPEHAIQRLNLDLSEDSWHVNLTGYDTVHHIAVKGNHIFIISKSKENSDQYSLSHLIVDDAGNVLSNEILTDMDGITDMNIVSCKGGQNFRLYFREYKSYLSHYIEFTNAGDIVEWGG